MLKPVLIDANLLVLLIAGLTDRRLIERHKNLSGYDEDAFELLLDTLREFSSIILTPNTLTEASNLLRQIREPDRENLTRALHYHIQNTKEHYIPSGVASNEMVFIRLGLTDAVLMKAARNHIALLSADKALYLAAAREGLEALNFAHIYDQRFGG